MSSAAAESRRLERWVSPLHSTDQLPLIGTTLRVVTLRDADVHAQPAYGKRTVYAARAV
jgi:hypothetical protein